MPMRKPCSEHLKGTKPSVYWWVPWEPGPTMDALDIGWCPAFCIWCIQLYLHAYLHLFLCQISSVQNPISDIHYPVSKIYLISRYQSLYLYVYFYPSPNIYIYISMYVCMYCNVMLCYVMVCMSICHVCMYVYICMYVCMYVYIYMCTYVHIYAYVYVHVHM
jgi:nuclear pore complex protein Nup62